MNRYSWLSSEKDGGPGSGAPAHLARPKGATTETVRLVEGTLKANVVAHFTRHATIGMPGAGAVKSILHVLQALAVKTVILALDADAARKPHVARALRNARDELARRGYEVQLERWDKADGKGPDDLRATGKEPRLLTGPEAAEEAQRLAADAEQEATAPEGLPEYVAAVLEQGGAAGLYRDGKAMEALATAKLDHPAVYAAIRADLDGKVRFRDLDTALKPLVERIEAIRKPASVTQEARYAEEGGCICLNRQAENQTISVVLASFTARITEEVEHDDGQEKRLYLNIAGALPDGQRLPGVPVSAGEYEEMSWVLPAWGARAIVQAGKGARDHARAAIQTLSGKPARRTIYTHTGWRQISDRWVYLHAGGAIGEEGAVAGVETQLPDALALYELPPRRGGTRAGGPRLPGNPRREGAAGARRDPLPTPVRGLPRPAGEHGLQPAPHRPHRRREDRVGRPGATALRPRDELAQPPGELVLDPQQPRRVGLCGEGRAAGDRRLRAGGVGG
jgi:hypothetical protein